MAGGQEHALADGLLRPAPGALRVRRRAHALARATRDRVLPDGLLPPGARPDGRGDARVRLPAEPGDRPREHRPRPPRHPGPALVPLAVLVEAVPDAARALGGREPDDHLPRRGDRRAAPPLRVVATGRRGPAPAHPLRDAPLDQPGDPVRGRDRGDRQPAVLHAGVRRRRRRAGPGRLGERHEPRLPGGLDALLSGAPLPAGIPLLQHGLRVGDGDAPARRRARGHAR